MGKITFGRAAAAFKRLFAPRAKCLEPARSAVRGKSGIEIGGPSETFKKRYYLPIYGAVGSLDNCDFSQSTTWANHARQYQFKRGKAAGRTFFCEGSNLEIVADDQYDFLLSCHNLEHFANPMKALKEWQRVVKPGGHLVLVLPHYKHTFDQGRPLTSVRHMLEDYEQETGEDDLTHVEEVLEAMRQKGEVSNEERVCLLNNFTHRMMHHHVFDEINSRDLLEALGLTVLKVETRPPFHIFLVAQFPL